MHVSAYPQNLLLNSQIWSVMQKINIIIAKLVYSTTYCFGRVPLKVVIILYNLTTENPEPDLLNRLLKCLITQTCTVQKVCLTDSKMSPSCQTSSDTSCNLHSSCELLMFLILRIANSKTCKLSSSFSSNRNA